MLKIDAVEEVHVPEKFGDNDSARASFRDRSEGGSSSLPFFLYFEREIDDVVPKQRILGLKQCQVANATCISTALRRLWPVWKRHHIIGLVIDLLHPSREPGGDTATINGPLGTGNRTR